MDILKVLSRGTKQARVNFPTNTTLPSAGASVTPQLYHDSIAQSSRNAGRKRKRATSGLSDAGGGGRDGTDSEHDDAQSEASDLSELDFFGERTKTAEPTSARQAKKAKAREEKSKNKREWGDAVVLLDEDECRRILRSHRLKFTLLTDKKAAAAAAAAAAAEAEKKKKKAKKSKKDSRKSAKEAEAAAAAAAKVAKDDSKRQLYPQPLTAFAQLRHIYRLSPRLADNLERLLYRIPTEVQMGSLPLLLDPALALRKTTVPPLSGSVGTRVHADHDDDDGLDFMAVAPTGSGKTLSFLVPAINGILKRRAEAKEVAQDDQTNSSSNSSSSSRPKHDHVLDTIVVAPTRELAHQIANEGKKLAAGTGVRVVAMRKGMRVPVASADGKEEEEEEEEEEAEESDNGTDEHSTDEKDEEDAASDGEDAEESDSGEDDGGKTRGKLPTKTKKKAAAAATVTHADVLVTTPLLLLNMLTRRRSANKTLPTVRTLVLDEADVLLDPLFIDQTLGLWAACTHPRLHASFWSATMASNVEALVAEQLFSGAAPAGPCGCAADPPPAPAERGKLLAMRQLLHPATSTSVVGAGAGSGGTNTGTGTGTGTGTETGSLRPPFLSAWERRREHNLREAIASSKQRKKQQQQNGKAAEDEEWGGLE
ncbi:ATP dependent RNA helicase [Niveomyces insectorum RCEF 264]|uniref:ATP-dependent RNA helicase n=1 Tax=Niveomyces insectorum RCEF 264 TaxID=1081102 RepID=A0A167NAE7_9HYPO|nr:ATP dependent RNA helicase [Niveomyces insectorum RCEF 264]